MRSAGNTRAFGETYVTLIPQLLCHLLMGIILITLSAYARSAPERNMVDRIVLW